MIVVNPSTRQFNIPGADLVFGVTDDASSEVKHFQCPRYVGNNLDLAGSFIRMNYRNANGEIDFYLVKDVTVDGDNVTFSWELSPKVTMYKGNISFVMCVVGPDTKVKWHTTLGRGQVLEGLEPDSSLAESETEDGIAALIAMVEAQTVAVENKGVEWVRNVQSEGTDQIVAVQTAGAEAKTAAVAEIEAKGVNTRNSIPNDYTALSEAVDSLTRGRAGAIVCEAAGETVTVSDASDLPMQGLRVFGKTTQVTTTGKNLLNVSAENALNVAGYTKYSIEKGVITITGDSFFAFKMPVTRGNTYTFSLDKKATESTCHFRVYEYTDVPVSLGESDTNYIATPINSSCAGLTHVVKQYAPIVDNVAWIAVGFYTNQPNVFTNFQGELGVDETEYEPYSGLKPSPSPEYPQELVSLEPVVTVTGKNLLNTDAFKSSNASGGFKADYEGDGIIHIYGTATQTEPTSHMVTDLAIPIDPSKNYTFHTEVVSGKVNGAINLHTYLAVGEAPGKRTNWLAIKFDSTNSAGEVRHTVGNASDFNKDAKFLTRFWVYARFPAIDDTMDIRIRVWLTATDAPTTYEPYKPIQTLEVVQSLPGIPVTSGGNYTDENGQQWVCNEVDLERGVYVQRVNKKTLTENDIRFANTEYVEFGTYVFTTVTDTRDTGTDLVVISDKLFGIPAHYRTGSGYDDKYRCYAQSGVVYLRFPAGTGEKTLEECKAAFAGVTVQYVLATPVETPLSETEIAAYRAIHSNYPNTTVLNDSGAHMVVKYAADTKLYIDNKIAALVGG